MEISDFGYSDDELSNAATFYIEEVKDVPVKKDETSNIGKDYELIKELGQGGYGNVYKVKSKGKYYAMKIYKDINQVRFYNKKSVLFDERNGSKPEIDFIQRVNHPNIIKGYSLEYKMMKGSITPVVFMELADGSLLDAIGPNISARDRLFWIYDILSANKFVGEQGYIHCDLKLENILLKGDTAKISDPGLIISREDIGNLISTNLFCNPLITRAPEMWIDFDVDDVTKYISNAKDKKVIKRVFREYRKFINDETNFNKNRTPGYVSLNDIIRAEFFTLGRLIMDIYRGSLPTSYELIYFNFAATNMTQNDLVKYLSSLQGWPVGDRAINGMTELIARLLDGNPDKRLTSYDEIINSKPFIDNAFTSFTGGSIVTPSLSSFQSGDLKTFEMMIDYSSENNIPINHLSRAFSLYYAILNLGIEDMYDYDAAIISLYLSSTRKNRRISNRKLLDNMVMFWIMNSKSEINDGLAEMLLDSYYELNGIVTIENVAEYSSNANVTMLAMRYYINEDIRKNYTMEEYVVEAEKEYNNTRSNEQRYKKSVPIAIVKGKLKEILFGTSV
jgi:serine/threonine protein kinase